VAISEECPISNYNLMAFSTLQTIGIYRIVDGKLEICLRKQSKERPTDFKTSKDDPQNVLVKFKREPAQK
jgi:hypothetical protein